MAPGRFLRASLTFRNLSQLLWVSLSQHAIRAKPGSHHGCAPLPSAPRTDARAPMPPFPSDHPRRSRAQAVGRRLSDPGPVPASLARGQAGPAQSPRAAGHAQPAGIPHSESHSRAGLRDRRGDRGPSPRAGRAGRTQEGPGWMARLSGRARRGCQVGAIPAGKRGVPQRRDRVRRGECSSETHGTE